MVKRNDDSKLFAFLAVLLSVVGFIIALLVKKDDKYVMFYAKQSLVLFFGWIAVWIVSMILRIVPIIGAAVHYILYIIMAILWLIALIYSLSGEMKEIPVIGQFADNFNI